MTYLGCREGIKRLPKKLTSIKVRCQGQSELNRKGGGRCEGRGKEHQVSLQNTWYTDMKRRKERWEGRQDTLQSYSKTGEQEGDWILSVSYSMGTQG